ncbi:cobalt ABC transporter permease [Janibacter sp. Soil728]|uniref:PDGLE domain-containing protein n=1 Tax=Janibacter sp. Soil728 TaxID=1736393 RepID=UPI000700179D|nr:PDGLE domain-containing protein [Janibacter sp. Soil728]KRE37772.1 cobalt ABC transporter permease [Janibacter sp. Soil728]
MKQRISTRTLVLGGLAVCLLLAAIVSFWVSGHPDGLEHVAETLGFADSAGDHGSAGSPFADYGTKGVDSGFLSGGLAGVVGVLLTGALMWLLLRLVVRRRD